MESETTVPIPARAPLGAETLGRITRLSTLLEEASFKAPVSEAPATFAAARVAVAA